jgi:hypothetical protein
MLKGVFFDGRTRKKDPLGKTAVLSSSTLRYSTAQRCEKFPVGSNIGQCNVILSDLLS